MEESKSNGVHSDRPSDEEIQVPSGNGHGPPEEAEAPLSEEPEAATPSEPEETAEPPSEPEETAEPPEVSGPEGGAGPEAPAPEEPAPEEPALEEPALEEPALEEPAAEAPERPEITTEPPVADIPVIEVPAQIAEPPAAEEAPAKEPVAGEPVAEEPAAEEPTAEEPVAEEPAAEEPVAAEPVVEEPVAEELPDEVPAAAEPAPLAAEIPAAAPGEPSPELAAAVEEALEGVEEDEAIPEWVPGEWFVVHTYAGYENKVKTNLETRVHSMNMEDKIYEVVIPMEDVMEIKSGKKQVVQRKVFPGYLLVRMELDDDSWYVVRNTPGVTGFVGSGTKPIPLSEKEVDRILQRKGVEEKPKPKIEYSPGDGVRVVAGPFANFQGVISEIDMDRSKLKVLVNIFGRETPVELGFDQVAKL